MPRHGGNTRSAQRRKHAGHRMHVRGHLARRVAKLSKRRIWSGWDPASTWDDTAGRWV